MKTTSWKLVLVAALALVVVACAQAVRNVNQAPIAATKANLALEDVTKSIIRAAGSLGWRVKVDKPGHIAASIALRTHTATVDITYNTETYDIKYSDSTNLGYDGTNIHKNYNGWIQNLERDTNFQLTTL